MLRVTIESDYKTIQLMRQWSRKFEVQATSPFHAGTEVDLSHSQQSFSKRDESRSNARSNMQDQGLYVTQ